MRPRSSKLMCSGCRTSGSDAIKSMVKSSCVFSLFSDSAGESGSPPANGACRFRRASSKPLVLVSAGPVGGSAANAATNVIPDIRATTVNKHKRGEGGITIGSGGGRKRKRRDMVMVTRKLGGRQAVYSPQRTQRAQRNPQRKVSKTYRSNPQQFLANT